MPITVSVDSPIKLKTSDTSPSSTNLPSGSIALENESGRLKIYGNISGTVISTPGEATTSTAGYMSAADKIKLNGIAAGANAYTHPTYTSRSSGLYKITVDGTGHVSAVTAVAKSDITALGIPGSDTNTTYSAGNGLTLTGTTFAVNTSYATTGKNYAVRRDSTSGGLYVNVPWTDTNTVYTHPSYTAHSTGFYKFSNDATGHVNAVTAVTKSDITSLVGKATSSSLGLIQTGYSTSGKNYAVVLDGSNNAYVNVPWTDTNTTYSAATSSRLGLVRIGYSPSGNNFAVQLNGSNQMYVNLNDLDINVTLVTTTI